MLITSFFLLLTAAAWSAVRLSGSSGRRTAWALLLSASLAALLWVGLFKADMLAATGASRNGVWGVADVWRSRVPTISHDSSGNVYINDGHGNSFSSVPEIDCINPLRPLLRRVSLWTLRQLD